MGRSGLQLTLPLCATVAVAAISPVHAQTSPQPDAETLNEQGKLAYKAGEVVDAEAKFRRAIAVSPQGRYYFNLCFVLSKQGRLDDALTACGAVSRDNADSALVAKTQTFVRDNLTPTLADDPSTEPSERVEPTTPPATRPSPQGPPPPAPTRRSVRRRQPPPRAARRVSARDALQAAVAPNQNYQWSIGAEVGPLRNLNIGAAMRSRSSDAFADVGLKWKAYANLLLSQANQLGLQGYLSLTQLDPSEARTRISQDRELRIVDLGAAIYQHHRLSDRLQWSWLGGAHIAAMNVGQASDEGFWSLGFRGELSLAYLMGQRRLHELKISPVSIDVYLPSQSISSDDEVKEVSLDHASAAWSVTIGYTARFDSAFGPRPLFTLE